MRSCRGRRECRRPAGRHRPRAVRPRRRPHRGCARRGGADRGTAGRAGRRGRLRRHPGSAGCPNHRPVRPSRGPGSRGSGSRGSGFGPRHRRRRPGPGAGRGLGRDARPDDRRPAVRPVLIRPAYPAACPASCPAACPAACPARRRRCRPAGWGRPIPPGRGCCPYLRRCGGRSGLPGWPRSDRSCAYQRSL